MTLDSMARRRRSTVAARSSAAAGADRSRNKNGRKNAVRGIVLLHGSFELTALRTRSANINTKGEEGKCWHPDHSDFIIQRRFRQELNEPLMQAVTIEKWTWITPLAAWLVLIASMIVPGAVVFSL